MKKTLSKEHMRQISRKGVAARQKKRAEAQAAVTPPTWPLPNGKQPQTAAECVIVGSWALREAGLGRMPSKTANAISGLVRSTLKAIEARTTAEDLEAARALLEELKQNATGKPGVQAMRAKGREALARKRAREQASDDDEVPQEIVDQLEALEGR